MKAFFDSSILIDMVHGHAQAIALVYQYQTRYISRIAWIEVLVGATDEEQKQRRLRGMEIFTLVELNEEISREAIEIRKKHRLKLPDSIIWATARMHNLPLITRNTKDFPADDPLVIFPYRIN